jgi:hypothetical protein
VAAWVAVFLSLGIVVAGLVSPSVSIPLSILRIDGATISLVGVLFSLLGLLLVRYPSPGAVSLVFLQVVGISAFILGGKEAGRGTREISIVSEAVKEKVWTNSVDWGEPVTERWPDTGYRGKANAAARHHHRDYDVTYRMGPDGFRVMPEARSGETAPEIVFLGCSMTFGIGVEDDQHYTWLLAKNAWPDYRVRAWAVSGWGTIHAAVMLDKALARQPKPALVVYSMIAHHLERNYLRESWRTVGKASFPFFNDQGEFVRMRSWTDGNLPNTKEVDEAEMRTTRAVIGRMQEKCDKAGVPFAVLLLQDLDRYGRDVMKVLDHPGLRVVDVRDDFSETHPSDAHLTLLGHQRLARAIAKRKDFAELTGRADLYQPDVFPERFLGEDSFRSSLYLDEVPEKHRRCHLESSSSDAAVSEIESFSTEPFQMRLGRLLPSFAEGQVLTLSFESHAPRPRGLSFTVENWSLPAKHFAKVTKITTDRGVTTAAVKLTEGCRSPRFIVQFGGDDTPFSITRFHASVSDQLPAGFGWLETFPESPISSDAAMSYIDSQRDSCRIDRLKTGIRESWTIKYLAAAGAVEKGRTYLISARLRADREKKIDVGLNDLSQPSKIISNYMSVQIGAEEKEVRLEATATEDESAAAVAFLLGVDETPVEVSHVKMEPVQPGS